MNVITTGHVNKAVLTLMAPLNAIVWMGLPKMDKDAK